jgi:L-ribulose-5-phosphate 3-epimerase
LISDPPALSRRAFASAIVAGVSNRASAQDHRFIKGICSGIFPPAMPYAERCRKAKAAGFDAIEFPMSGELDLSTPIEQVKRLGGEAHSAGVLIASLWVSPPLAKTPLNSPDPSVREQGCGAIAKALTFAQHLDCGALLLVPGRVGVGPKFEVGYETTWQRFSTELKKLAPLAESAHVLLTMENVSNRFLVSPLEMRAFIDQFDSPWVQAHFDTGNVMYFGYPQDWILTLGKRIRRVHVKDRKVTPQAEAARPSRLLEGDVNWKEVMRALVEVGYRGPVSPEIERDPSDPSQLDSVSKALDKILAMA